MRSVMLMAMVVVMVPAVLGAEPKDELAPPVHVLVNGKPLDTGGLGYAAPFFADFDGDSVRDLLVGEMQFGQMRIHRNVGTNERPEFDDSFWFQFVVDEVAESGRVPAG